MIPGPYNNNYQILQTPGYVVILHEMIHDARIIPLDGPSALGQNIRQWFGDSRGRWEGDTLVVDTTNFTDKANFRGSTEGLHLIERFTRVNADTVKYEFTIDDPATFTKKWTVAIPMAQHRRADLRVRLSRGELRDGEPSKRGAGSGEGKGRSRSVSPRFRFAFLLGFLFLGSLPFAAGQARSPLRGPASTASGTPPPPLHSNAPSN